MALAAQKSFRFGLAKEAARLTAEAAPTKWYPLIPDPEIKYGPQLLNDDGLRGVFADYEPIAGRSPGTGKFKIVADAQVLGELMRSMLGAPTSAQQGGTAAYQHSYTLNTGVQPNTYTFFMDFGGSVGVKKYNGCVVKSMNFTGPVDGLIMVDVEFLFITEVAGSIGSPSFPTQRYFNFKNVTYKIAGSTNTDVMGWELSIDNQAHHLMTLAQAYDAQDIVVTDSIVVKGSMAINFQNETERNKFLANTAVAIQMLIEGAVIASTFKWTLDLPVTAAHYQEYPFGWENKLLASKVNFQGFHNGTSIILPKLINVDTAY